MHIIRGVESQQDDQRYSVQRCGFDDGLYGPEPARLLLDTWSNSCDPIYDEQRAQQRYGKRHGEVGEQPVDLGGAPCAPGGRRSRLLVDAETCENRSNDGT